jgi:hypothetical protein
MEMMNKIVFKLFSEGEKRIRKKEKEKTMFDIKKKETL